MSKESMGMSNRITIEVHDKETGELLLTREIIERKKGGNIERTLYQKEGYEEWRSPNTEWQP